MTGTLLLCSLSHDMLFKAFWSHYNFLCYFDCCLISNGLGLVHRISELTSSLMIFFFIEMELTTDEFLKQIGSFGRYQILLTVFSNVAYMLWWGMPTMVMLFITPDPGWKCKNNLTCPFTEIKKLGDDNYSYRCDIPREDWEFGEDFTSVVTEVKEQARN